MRLQFGTDEWLHILMAMRVAQKTLTQGEHYTPGYDRAIGYRVIGELMRLVKVSPNTPQIAAKIDAAMLLEALPEPEAKPAKPRRLNAAGFPVDDEDDELAAPAPRPARRGPVIGPPVKTPPLNMPFKDLDLSDVPVRAPSEPEPEPEPVPESPAAPVPESASKPDNRRQAALEAAVNQALQGLTQALTDIKELREAHTKLAGLTDKRLKAAADEPPKAVGLLVADVAKLTDAHNTLASSTHERFLAVDEYVYAIEDKLAALKKKRGA